MAGRRNNNNNGVNYNDRRGIWRKLGNRSLFGSSSDSNIRNDEDEWDSDNQSRDGESKNTIVNNNNHKVG